VCSMQERRDSFLDSVLERFPQLDAEEIYEILSAFKEPFILLAQQNGQNENASVNEPWSFERLAIFTRNDMKMSLETVQRNDDQVFGL